MKVTHALLGTLCALLIVSAASASIVDPRKGQKATPEQSQDVVGKQQALQGTFGKVGMVPKDTEVYSTPGTASDEAAAGVIALSAKGSAPSDPNAARVLVEASADAGAAAGRSPAGTVAWGLLFLALGFGAIFGVRQWVVKNIPEPAPTKTHVEW